jgi:aspartyl-tRNA(Asn)/glutamyl-tRNA(Gln) amidotransferase subunit A
LFRFSSIEEYHSCLKNGSVSTLQAVEFYLSAIRKHASINAFLEVYEEEALARAKELDAGPIRGRLHGVVIGLKDNICYQDHMVSAASAILGNFISLFSATAVQRLINEGAIIIGRQNCDEFGMGSTNENSAYGPVLNPHDPERVAGGSSGGSAAAVAAGLCMASLGSDTGGSVRLPADHCGVVGLKPAYGRVSRHGLIAYASSFDQVGILANSVKDAALILDVIGGPDEYDSTALENQPSISFMDESPSYSIAYFPEWLEHPSLDPEIRKAIDNCIQSLKQKGHKVEPVHFELTDYIVPTYYILTTAEASSNLSRYDGVRFGTRTSTPNRDLADFYRSNRTQGFGKEVKRRIMLGSFVLSSGYFDAYFTRAQKLRQRLKQNTELIFNQFDFLIAPNSPNIAPRLGEKTKDPTAMYMGDIFTVFANLTGITAVSVPIFKHSSNLSFGLQIASRQQNEVPLLRFSHQLMQQ